MNFFSQKKYNLFILGTCLYACTPSQSPTTSKEPTIISVGTQNINTSEFKYAYEKSTTKRDSLYQEKHLRDYLKLFSQFKLKIAEGKKRGMDTTENFKQEFAGYQEQLAMPFLLDTQAQDSLIKTTYKRLQEEIQASHILIRIPTNASPADTLNAFIKMGEALAKTATNEPFAQIAKQYSQDPSVESNGGNLGYFTALQMVYPFEDVAYRTPKGKVSGIFRTNFGYHILKVHDRRSTQGKLQIAHIMKQIPQKPSESEQSQAKKIIEEAYEKLQNGETWESVCTKYSDDATSVSKGGLLPPFKVGEILPELENTAFTIGQVGEYSKPVLSPYGWHIVKLVEKTNLLPFAEMQNSLRAEVSKESRFEYLQEVFVKKLKKEFNYKTPETKKYENIRNMADKRLLQGSWSYDLSKEITKEKLFTLKSKKPARKKEFFVKDFLAYAYLKQVTQSTLQDEKYYLDILYKNFEKESLLNFEKENLLDKKQEYRYLVQEYKEGIMLFELMREKVWNKALEDTTALKDFFEKNKQNYQWGQRATANIYTVANTQALQELKTYLLRKNYPVTQVKIPNLLFDKNSNALTEETVRITNEVVDIMRQDPNLRLEIIAHADPSEKATLAQERLDPFIKQLAFKRIDEKRLIIKNFGNSQPISKTNRALNQRIELALYSVQKKQLEYLFNQIPNTLKITEGTFQKGDNTWLDKVEWKAGNYTLNQPNGQVIYIEIADIKIPRPKAYDEARGYVVTDYQKFLEKTWLEELERTYPTKINEVELKKLIK